MIAALAAIALALSPPPAQRGEAGRGAADPDVATTATRDPAAVPDARDRKRDREDAEMLRDLELLQRLDLLEHLDMFDDERGSGR